MHLAFFFFPLWFLFSFLDHGAAIWFLFPTPCYLMTLPETYDENVKRMKDVVTSVCAVFIIFLLDSLIVRLAVTSYTKSVQIVITYYAQDFTNTSRS